MINKLQKAGSVIIGSVAAFPYLFSGALLLGLGLMAISSLDIGLGIFGVVVTIFGLATLVKALMTWQKIVKGM